MEIMLTLLSLQVRYSMRIPKFENWVQGSKYVVNDINNKDIRGEYDLTIADKKYKWIINGDIETPKSEVNTTDSKSYPPNFRFPTIDFKRDKIKILHNNIHSLNRIYRTLKRFLEKQFYLMVTK
jgi:hypothetical protein